eukprot:scaffold1954_cov268-Pinguiococcus_pyrenoidosus.AAC.33
MRTNSGALFRHNMAPERPLTTDFRTSPTVSMPGSTAKAAFVFLVPDDEHAHCDHARMNEMTMDADHLVQLEVRCVPDPRSHPALMIPMHVLRPSSPQLRSAESIPVGRWCLRILPEVWELDGSDPSGSWAAATNYGARCGTA